MRLSYIAIAAAALFSQGALAEGNRAAPDKQAQSSASSAMQPSASIIKQAQEKLSAAGHDAGPADGVLGAKTKQALKDFQKAKNLEATGQLDQRTLAELGVDAAGVGATAASAPRASVGGSSGEKSPGPSGSTKSY
jgi:peptidoglycan hydrolase-like protein with peptidoglycan-binding domain